MSENSSSCNITDGEVSFSNKDDLEWNQKKQDMMLNLGLTHSNSETDQTPTPTRFIRNCEEVGLFQDLQNVNPFDEVFKKAVEDPTSISLKLPTSTSDDTLHTPQIYPQLEENSKFSSTNTTTTSNEYSLSNVISRIEHKDDGDNPLVIVLDSENDKQTLNDCDKTITNSSVNVTTKETNKERIKQKVIDAIIQKKSTSVTPIPLTRLIDHEKQSLKNSAYNTTNMAELLRQREANKAAQTRCRKRKQREFERMIVENQNLRKENIRLTGMNLYLQETVKKLEAELQESRASTLMETTSTSEIAPGISQSQSTENKQSGRLVKTSQVKGNNKSSNEPNRPTTIAPNVKTVVVPLPIQAISRSLPLPGQNIQSSLNNTVVLIYPGYMPPQSSVVSTNLLSQPVNPKTKLEPNYKKIEPK